MPSTIDHAAALATSWEVTAGRATCTCGWRGPLRDTEIDARADRDRHQRDHEAFLAGYRMIGSFGVNSFAMHAHGLPVPTDDQPGHVPVSVEFVDGQPVSWAHAHDGGAIPHVH